MSNDAQIARATRHAPTDADVAVRTAELAALEAELADRELLLKTCRAGLRAFEASYLRAVRPRYAELDRVEAEIAEAMAAFDPDDEDLAERARATRERANASAEASDAVAAEDASGCHTPSVGLKRLYRRVALQMHPDRGADPDEVAYRHDLMVEANRAYRDGDAELLETLLGLFDAGEDESGERVELRRVLWQINRTRRRLAEVASALEDVESSEIFGIWREAELAADQGRDLVAERVASIRRSLAKAQARLEALRSSA